MGQMVDGVWDPVERQAHADGGFVRPSTVFRDKIEVGGRFEPEVGRYHLYASLACPWAHRTLIFRTLKGLQPLIGLSITHWLMGEEGWNFTSGPGVIPDPDGARLLHQIYTRANASYTGRISVPVLWDRKTRTIVSNESAEIIRMFNSAFDHLGAKSGDYYPVLLRDEIDAINAQIYQAVNNGVYRAGFASTQAAYADAVDDVFRELDRLESRLADRAFLCGSVVTEADWRLFTTLVRFDAVYHGHFKCNRMRIQEYPALRRYLKVLYDFEGVSETVNLDHIKQHYYMSHPWINPTRIVADGPRFDFRSV